MALSAPHVCQCGKLVPHGTRCSCQLTADAQRKARHDATRPSSSARGYDKRWKFERRGFLRSHPKCRMCSAPATVVDHIKPHKGDKALFWAKSNWQPLCAHCHSSRKQREERR